MKGAFLACTFLLPSAPAAPQEQEVHRYWVPALEEIFADPPPFGRRPADVRISADGTWCLYRMEQEPEEEEAAEEEGPSQGRRRGRRQRTWFLASTDGRHDLPLRTEGRSPSEVVFAPQGREVRFRDGRRILAADPEGSLEQARPLLALEEEPRTVRFLEGGRILYRTGEGWFLLDPARGERAGRLVTRRGGSSSHTVARRGDLVVFRAPLGEEGGERSMGLYASRSGRDREVLLASADADATLHLSADGRWVAFTTTRRDPQGPPHLLPDYLTPRVTVRDARRSTAADRWPERRVYLLSTAQPGRPLEVQLPGSARRHLRTVSFAPRGARLLLQVESEDFKERSLFVVEPPDARPRQVDTERDEAWVGPLARTAFFSSTGDHVLFTSERSGFAHLYTVPARGGEPRALTEGPWEVTHARRIGETRRLLLVTSEEHSSERSLRVMEEDGSGSLRVPHPRGWAEDPAPSADASRVAFLLADLFVPADLHAAPLGPGEAVRLTDTVPEAFRARPWAPPEEVRIRNPEDGTMVPAQIHRPPWPPPEGGHPAVIFLHGAGYLQNVRRSMTYYDVNLLFHHRLARRGYVVLNPDFRGSSGYGRKFRADVHHNLGGPERGDVKACKEWLVRHEGVDPSRVGLYGGSYGGFLTLMLLFMDPEEFACGAALRSVTDWSTYHPGYTQPRLGNLEDGEEVYRRTSPLHFAENLRRPLLLTHGMMDSNVFVQDTVRLMERLIELGKDFEAMLYPSQEHRFTAPAAWVDQYRRIERFFDRHLLGPPGAPRRAGRRSAPRNRTTCRGSAPPRRRLRCPPSYPAPPRRGRIPRSAGRW